MAAIGLAALRAPRRLAASFATVDLPAITIGTDEEKCPASAAKTLAEERFRGSRHRRREGLDSHTVYWQDEAPSALEAPQRGCQN
jgi:hypothetical protein